MTVLVVSVAASADDGYGSAAASFDAAGTYWKVGREDISGQKSHYPFCRFLNVTIPQGSIISSAYLEVVANANSAYTAVKTKVAANDADSPAAPTTWAQVTGLTLTTAQIDWDFAAVTAGVAYTSPDIGTVIKEIVDRAGWASGNNLILTIFDDSSTSDNRHQIASYDHLTYAAPQLTVTYVYGGNVIIWTSD